MTEYLFAVLLEDYKQSYSSLSELGKLQFQIIGLAYTVAGGALSLWIGSGSDSKPSPIVLLLFAMVFCAFGVIQVYIHSGASTRHRYVNFRLRPRVEALLASGTDVGNTREIWTWGEYFDSPIGIPRYVIRQLGVVIMLLPVFPAVMALVIHYVLYPPPWQDIQKVLTVLDLLIIVGTLCLVPLVIIIDKRMWKLEEQRLAEGIRSQAKVGDNRNHHAT